MTRTVGRMATVLIQSVSRKVLGTRTERPIRVCVCHWHGHRNGIAGAWAPTEHAPAGRDHDGQRGVEYEESRRGHSSPAALSPGHKEHDQRDLVRDSIGGAEISHRQAAGLGKCDRPADNEDHPGEDESEARELADAILKVVSGFGAIGWDSALHGDCHPVRKASMSPHATIRPCARSAGWRMALAARILAFPGRWTSISLGLSSS